MRLSQLSSGLGTFIGAFTVLCGASTSYESKSKVSVSINFKRQREDNEIFATQLGLLHRTDDGNITAYYRSSVGRMVLELDVRYNPGMYITVL